MDKKDIGGGRKRPRRGGRFVTTRSGKVLKVHRSIGEKLSALKGAKDLRKVERLQGLPKSRAKRLLWRLRPRQLYHYWFSRDGGLTALKLVGIGILVFFVLTLGIFAYFRKDLPDIKDRIIRKPEETIEYYAAKSSITIRKLITAMKSKKGYGRCQDWADKQFVELDTLMDLEDSEWEKAKNKYEYICKISNKYTV